MESTAIIISRFALCMECRIPSNGKDMLIESSF